MINLLPPEQKEFIVLENKKRLIMILGVVGFVFFVSLTLILLSVEFYVAGQVKAQKIILQQKQREFQAAEIKALQEEIDLANQNFSKLKSFYEEQISLLWILEEIYYTLPPEVYLNRFSYNNREITLFAYAPTRAILLRFRENLIIKEEFKGIEFPNEPWIKPVDIEFYVRFQVDREKEGKD